MRSPINIILFLALILLASVSAGGDGTPADEETWKYHGYALAEVWIGRAAINVGDMQGQQMFSKMMTEIARDCGPERGDMKCEFKGTTHQVSTHYVKNIITGEIGDTYFGFDVWAVWESEEYRLLLINAVARTMQALTETGTSENCYAVPGHGKFCNIGNFIRVNLDRGTGDNHMWVTLYGDKVHGVFKCCPTRYKVDGALDSMKDDFVAAYPPPYKAYSRDVKCLIKGMTSCEDCDSRCDVCGREC